MSLRAPVVALALLAIGAPAASAATPESGKLTKEKPVLRWTGSAQSFPLTLVNILSSSGGTTVCEPSTGTCDEFTLELATSDKLTIYSKSGSLQQMEVVQPDGTTTFSQTGMDNGDPEIQVFDEAKPGTYIVRIWQNSPAPEEYGARAALGFWGDDNTLDPGDEGAPPVGGSAPAPAPAPAPAAAPGPAAAPAPSIAITGRAARAARLRVKLTATAPLTKVRAALLRGRTTVASGSLARLDGSGTLSLRARKRVKPGRYRLAVVGTTANGGRVAATTPFTVRR